MKKAPAKMKKKSAMTMKKKSATKMKKSPAKNFGYAAKKAANAGEGSFTTQVKLTQLKQKKMLQLK